MIYLSVCSGIEAASVAWHPLGWQAFGYSEIEKFPSALLAHHYRNTPNFGDMNNFKEWPDATINLLVGGTPCQSFSVAGLRKGLDDPRGNLMLTYLAIAAKYRPKWLVWENVPGVLSSNGGGDFASLLRGLAECGYGFAYRVLDAQYFGVAQRRRRVFVVGCFGDWRSAAAVLFDTESMRGNPPPSRKTRQDITQVAGTLIANGGGLNRTAGNGNELDFCVNTFTKSSFGGYSEGVGTLKAQGGDLGGGSETLTVWPADVAPLLNASFASKQGLENQHIDGGAGLFVPSSQNLNLQEKHIVIPINTMTMMGRPSDDINPRMGLGVGEDDDPSPTLTKAHSHAVAYNITFCDANGRRKDRPNGGLYVNETEVTSTLTNAGVGTNVLHQMAVRRLTPRECERLQGFPDDYTLITDKTADGPRYKALGNSMAVPVMRWIGERIQMVEAISEAAA